MKNDMLDELIEKLKTKTLQYACENGVNVDANGFVCCLNPDHPDKNPSMHWWEEANGFYCFSCGTFADIFYLANIYEGKPLIGRDFIEENVFYLAKRYGYEYEHLRREMTQEEIEKQVYLRTMKIFADYVVKNKNKSFLENRNITEETAAKLLIGSVPSYKQCVDHLISAGGNKEIIDKIGINSRAINENKMIIIFKDEYGKPVSFTSREMINPTGEEIPKYINGFSTPIFHKGSLLYIWSDIKKKYNPLAPFIIVEGYIDGITAYQKGYTNIVALGSASFTDEHIKIIERDRKISSVAIALDQDKTGRARMIKIMERLKNMSTRKNYTFAVYKTGGKDLDEILNSSEGKLKLKEIFDFKSIFEYELMNLVNSEEELSEDLMLDRFVGIISKTDRPKEREEQARILASYLTQYSYNTILAEVDYLINGEALRYKKEIITHYKLAGDEIEKNPGVATQILEGLVDDLKNVNTKYNKNGHDVFSKAISNFGNFEKDKMDAALFQIKLNIPWLDELNLMPGNSIIVAAGPNVGKTSVYSMIAKNAIQHNDNVTVFYCSTDDSAEALYANLMSSMFNLPRSYTMNPYFHPKLGINNNNEQFARDLFEKYTFAKTAMEDLIKSKKLVIFDVKDEVDTWRGLEKVVKEIANDKDTENRYRILIVDSANKVSVEGKSNENDVAAFMSENLKKISEKYKFLTFENFELNKVKDNQKLSQNDLSGSRRMFYDCNVLGFVYNPSRNLRAFTGTENETRMTWPIKLKTGEIVNEPILVTMMDKTKNGNNEMIAKPYFYKLNTRNNTMIAIENRSEEHCYYESIWNDEWNRLYESKYQARN